ncbi:MAG TPA: EscU/YscU/HrcU family type III secretion system export apparatus switch protein [Thiothrix sp.]|nr:EscU/YscU/HrcU family type III secretion system export apparatus switch protein [Thiothrix sp.]
MSEDKSNKTEEPTPEKLRKAREKGQVARSEEFVPLFMILFAFGYFWFAWDWFIQTIQDFMLNVTAYNNEISFRESMGNAFNLWFRQIILGVMLPFSVLMFLASVIGNVSQFGFLISFESIKPKPEKISPMSGFKRIFSMKQLVKTLLSILKIIMMTAIIYYITRIAIREYMHDIDLCDVDCMLTILFSMIKKMLFILLPLLIALVLLDLIYQKANFKKEQRMSKDEIKREYKNREGDPLIKGQRKSEQRRILGEDLGEMIKQSRVVIAGLGRAAILMYTQDMPLPILLAIGRSKMSSDIIRMAKKSGVPIVSDPALVQLLEDDGIIDQYIPDSSIQRVAKAIQKGDQM